ncbi:kinase-like domain-containing protein [Apiospora arundinis]
MATCTTTASGSLTAVMEMHDMQAPHSKLEAQLPDESPQEDPGSPPPTATEMVQRWNYPKSNVPKIGACFWSFVVMGANDAAYGALIHYIEQYYNLTYTIVSLIFLSPFVGYTASALLNNYLHVSVGQRGVAGIASGCHMLAYIIIAIHPPYPVMVIAFMIAGFGNGLADAAWNAWVGNLDRANEMLGFLHGFYGLGAVLSPLIATNMVANAKLPWYTFYYIMIGLAGLEIFTSVAGFWTSTAAAYHTSIARQHGELEGPRGSLREALVTRPSARVTWLCALFLLGYVGIEVALGGWIVVFMIQVRQGAEFASGMTAMGFWLGITIGRVVLGFVTPRLGEKLAITIYLPIVMGLELLFWLVPKFIVSAIAVGLQGFFLGPLFPAAIVAMSKLLPRHLHVGAIGFAAAFGGSGAAVLPFAVGAIAQAKGVQVLQPIILALLGVITLLWLGLPRFNKKQE